MRNIGNKLSRQLLFLVIIVFGFVFIGLGVILPKALLPFYEENLYNYLNQTLYYSSEDLKNFSIDTEIVYIYEYENQIKVSNNIKQIIKIEDISSLLTYLTNSHGKFTFKGKDYYYYKDNNSSLTRFVLTNDSYILRTKKDVLDRITPIITITFMLVGFSLAGWSTYNVKRIEKLKEKIDKFDEEEHINSKLFCIDDEISALNKAIDDMKLSIKKQDELKNQMYQNISHDFKTPLTVIKSYIEASNDGVETKDNALKVIEEQTVKLEQKVKSLLYLNKLDYISSQENVEIKKINIVKLLEDSIEKFKFIRKDIKFDIDIDKRTIIYGTDDIWETIIDNMFNNFMRYANGEIKIIVKNNRITFYNDGINIEKELLDVLFNPFRKGIKGEFGLGLSIIKKSATLINYDVKVENNKVGVSFIFEKRINKKVS